MNAQIVGVLGVLALMGLIFLRVPVAVALGVTGLIGYAAVDGWRTALIVLGSTPFDLASGYSLSVVPLFILMGAVAARSEMSRELYQAANALFSGRRGGLAMATIGACAGFGAICGSSLATAATMTRVAVPEMRRYRYDERLATGAVASGGTLGILIPPSVILVIYAIIAEQSVPHLFAAALVPGLVLAALHVVVVWVLARVRPEWTPAGPAMSWAERVRALAGMWKLLLLFLLAVGGIYAGVFSPTEAAAVGAFGAIVIAVATRKISAAGLLESFLETVWTTAMLFFIILGAFLFAYFIVQTQLPVGLVQWTTNLHLPPPVVMVFLVVFYVILGCFLDSISMILITVPVFLPLIQEFGYSAVWFGILVVVVVEVGLITPPVGMNIFVIRAQLPDVSLGAIYRGIVPFLAADAVLIVMLLVLPRLALWLPGILY